MPEYSIGSRRGQKCLVYYDEHGKRHRYQLGTADQSEAERIAPAIYEELTRPGRTVKELWRAYNRDRSGRAILAPRVTTWKALKDRFGDMNAEKITAADCRAHMRERRLKGIKDGTLYTELSHLRTTLRWAEQRGYIIKAPYIERPPQPKPKEYHLTRLQCRELIDAAQAPHVELFIILALGTGGRTAALLELTWDRCNFETGMIDLRNPELKRPHKGRAIVPMNKMVKDALLKARKTAASRYVICWRENKITSVKKGLLNAAKEAGIERCSPHVLRHSVAVHLAEEGVDMEKIAQYLGHSDVNVTRKIYARFSPDYLRTVADALNY